MAIANNSTKTIEIDNSPIHSIIQWIRNIFTGEPEIPGNYEDEEYQRNRIRQEAQQKINRIKAASYWP